MILPKEQALKDIAAKYKTVFSSIPGKQIMYSGKLEDGRSIVICTPQSKLYAKGNAWVDITVAQYEIMNNADFAMLAVRPEDEGKIYLEFDQLKKYLSDKNMLSNSHEGDHWKLHIWPGKVKVIGGNTFDIKPG